MIFGINLKTPEDVKQLNRHASKFDFDVFVHGKDRTEIMDAKSLLGLMSFINKENLRLVVPDHVNKKAVRNGIENLLTA